jgi:hypothetical protein
MTNTKQQLEAALAELELWTSGKASLTNSVHGDVTGDYEHQALHAIEADNAQKIALAATVNGLAALLSKEIHVQCGEKHIVRGVAFNMCVDECILEANHVGLHGGSTRGYFRDFMPEAEAGGEDNG